MADRTYLDWPFLETRHKKLAIDLDDWAEANLPDIVEADGAHENVDETCRTLVKALGRDGWLKYCTPKAYGGVHDDLDVRSLALIREILARHSGLADFSFAMQGLGSGAISLFASEEIKQQYLPAVAKGEKIAAFALSEENAGSDAAALSTSMKRDGDDYVINGEKTWISNGGIADFYCVFARGENGVSAIVFDAGGDGFSITKRRNVIAPHPLATLRFKDARAPATHLIGEDGKGFKAALSTLDIFRTTVGAAALGLARRALDEAAGRALTRPMFGATLADQPIAQAMIADMALDIDAAALLVYRSAWTKDVRKTRVTREAAMAKLHATEQAQAVIDKAVQLFGGMGVEKGVKVEELYREIRALRIYEGASEVQKIVIARQVFQNFQNGGYANGISATGRMVFTALKNTKLILAEGGATPSDIVRMTCYVTSKREYLDSAKEIGGLYFALLTKKRLPDCEIDVYEQNRPDDTFGFGVVFSDETLDEFLSADPQSYDMIKDSFAYWTDIVIEHRSERTVVGGNGFAGCSRKTLLQLLQTRCASEGVRLHFEAMADVTNFENRFDDSDIIVIANGINSPMREKYKKGFGVRTENRRNYFTWLGSTKPLDAFTFFFQKTEHGPFCAHTYQYEEGHSTGVIETTPECWEASGFSGMSEEESARYIEKIFENELDGHSLITNRSIWRNFPVITCERWSYDNMVMLGDIKATAHWSIGSGTKLAMECAIALSDAVVASPDNRDAAFAAYEKERRTPVEITQHNAAVSLQWFEDMAMHWDKERYEFAFSIMSRAKSLTWDNIKLRDASFLENVENEFYKRYKHQTGRSVSNDQPTPMFTPFDLKGLTIPNRIVVAPMAQYSATEGDLTDWHFSHYTTFARGGAGLIFVEMTCPTPDARITPGCTGLWNDKQEADWKRIVDFIHENTTSKVALQLGHAGRKGSTKTPMADPKGRMDIPLDDGNWPIYSASPIPYFEEVSATPVEMDGAQMDAVRNSFVAAAARGARAGFDMLELHCAHGYLLASFLSPLTNQRQDKYGGDALARARFPLEVFEAVRAEWPGDKPMSVRLSSSDWAEGGMELDDLEIIAGAFKDAGVDIIHASSGQTVPWQKPVYGRMWQTPFAEFIKHKVGIPTIAVGDITLPEQANMIIAASRASR
ncbi:Salicyloyl-CoA 5-hydroxylase [Durusdinium trenchii]|uniref:Salicyloyl-CoA 5-hydroxylase n=1 Tax=Durusdinium trenchii TaxID=1381693 RepID=A0ABP0LVT5_9DINO